MIHLVQNSPIFTINQLFSLSRKKDKQKKKPEQINHKNRCSEQKDYLSVKNPFGKRNEPALRKFSDHITTSKREESQIHSKFQFLRKGKKDQSLHIKQISSRIIRNFSIKKVSQPKHVLQTIKFKYLKKTSNIDCLSTCGLFKIKCCNCCGGQVDDFNQKFEQILKERGLWKKQQLEGAKEKKGKTEQKEQKEQKLKQQIISDLASRFSKQINFIQQLSQGKSELERKRLIKTQKTSNVESPMESGLKGSSSLQQQMNEISVLQKVQKMKQKLIKIENEYFEHVSKDIKNEKQSRILQNGLLRWSKDISHILKMQSLRKYKSYLQGEHYDYNEQTTSSFFRQYKKSKLNSNDGDSSTFHQQQKLNKLRSHYQKNCDDNKRLTPQRNNKSIICQSQSLASGISNKQNQFNPKAVDRIEVRKNSLIKNPRRVQKRVGKLQFLEKKQLREIKQLNKGHQKMKTTTRFQHTNQIQSRSDASSNFSFSTTSICDENGERIQMKNKIKKTDHRQSEVSINVVSLGKISIDTSQKQVMKRTRKQMKQNEGKRKGKRESNKSKQMTSNSGQRTNSQAKNIKQQFRSFKSIKKSCRLINSNKSFEEQDSNEERAIRKNEKRIKKRRLGTIRKIQDEEELTVYENMKRFEMEMEKDIKLKKKMVSHLQESGFCNLIIGENETDLSLHRKLSDIEKIIESSENQEFKQILALYVQMYRKNRGIKRRHNDKQLNKLDFNYVFRRQLENKNLQTFLDEIFMGDQKKLLFYNLFRTQVKPPMEQQLQAIEIIQYCPKGRQIFLEQINLPKKQTQRVIEKPQNSKCFMKILHIFQDTGELIQTSI